MTPTLSGTKYLSKCYIYIFPFLSLCMYIGKINNIIFWYISYLLLYFDTCFNYILGFLLFSFYFIFDFYYKCFNFYLFLFLFIILYYIDIFMCDLTVVFQWDSEFYLDSFFLLYYICQFQLYFNAPFFRVNLNIIWRLQQNQLHGCWSHGFLQNLVK